MTDHERKQLLDAIGSLAHIECPTPELVRHSVALAKQIADFIAEMETTEQEVALPY